MRRKSSKAIETIDLIINHLTAARIYETYNYRSRTEFYMKGPINEALRLALQDLFRDRHPGYLERTIVRKAKKSLTWEGNVSKSLIPTELFGVTHRPDFAIEIDSMWIAVEIKCRDSASAIRSGLGQAIVYSTDYDFVIYLLIDTSPDSVIAQSAENEAEDVFIQMLWNDHNIRFVII